MAKISFISECILPYPYFAEAQVLCPLGTSGRTFLVWSKIWCSDTIGDRLVHSALRVYKVAAKLDLDAIDALHREWGIYQNLQHLQGVVIPEVNPQGVFSAFLGENMEDEYLCLDIKYCNPEGTFIKDDAFNEKFMNGIRALHAAGYLYDREFDDCHIVVDGDSPRLVGLGSVISGHDCPEVVWNGPDGLPIKPTRYCGELSLIEHVVYYEPKVVAAQENS